MRCFNCLAKLVLKHGVPLTYAIPVASLYYSIQHSVIQCVSDLQWFSPGTPVSSMTGATSRAGTIYPSGAPTFASGYFVGFTHFLVFRSVLSTIVCLSFFFFLCLLLFTASPLLSFYFPDFY